VDALRWANQKLNSKLVSSLIGPNTDAAGEASISSTKLTVTSVENVDSQFKAGMIVTGPGIAPSTWIVAQLDSGVAGIGTYTVSVSQNVAKTKIIGQFYFMNSIFVLVLQYFVIWWYWAHLMKFNASVLKFLRVDFEFFMGFRPVTIIFSVILFNVNFVFVRGLRHFVSIFNMVMLTKKQMQMLKDVAALCTLQSLPTTIILSYNSNNKHNPFVCAGSQFVPSLHPSNHQESANCRREKYVVGKLDRQIHPLGRIFAYRFCFLRELWLADEWFQSMIVLFEICLYFSPCL